LKSSLARGTRIRTHVTQPPGKIKELAQARETIARKNEKLEKLRRQMVVKDLELAKLRATLGVSGDKAQVEGVRPENIIWIFGTAKTGSTWLGSRFTRVELDYFLDSAPTPSISSSLTASCKQGYRASTRSTLRFGATPQRAACSLIRRGELPLVLALG
jgi:hypothetical protein